MGRNEISNQILHLRWNKQFDEALSLFKTHYHTNLSDDDIAEDEKLTSAIIDCLKALGKSKQALDFLIKNLKTATKSDINSKLAVNIAWLFLHTYKEKIPEKNRFQYYFPLINKLITNLKDKPGEYVFSKLLFESIEYWHEEKIDKAEKLLELLNTIPAEDMNDEITVIKTSAKGIDKEIELASDKEKYYSWKSKLEYAAMQYNNCIETSEKALDEIKNFHFGNNIWFARRIALSMKQQGNLQQAINKLQQILKKKNDWFLHREIAEIYAEQGDNDKAWEYAVKAFLQGGNSAYKVKLIDLMYKLTEQKNKILSEKLNHLQYIIRTENNWNISYKPTKPDNSRKTSLIFYKQIMQELDIAQNTKETKTEYTEGKITRILHEGANGDGFISDRQGRSIYFRFAVAQIKAEEIKTGLAVNCIVKEAFRNDKKVWSASKVIKK